MSDRLSEPGAGGAGQALLLRTHGEKHVPAAPSAPDDDRFPRGDPAELVAASTDPLATLLDLFSRARPSWHDSAACKRSGVDFTAAGKIERARAFDICGRCEVRTACLDWALEIGDDIAIMGGTDPAARRRMKRVAS